MSVALLTGSAEYLIERCLVTVIASSPRHGCLLTAMLSCCVQVGTWINGFGFQMMPDETLHRVRSSLRMLVFPGTSILHMPLQAAPISSDPPPSLWTVRVSRLNFQHMRSCAVKLQLLNRCFASSSKQFREGPGLHMLMSSHKSMLCMLSRTDCLLTGFELPCADSTAQPTAGRVCGGGSVARGGCGAHRRHRRSRARRPGRCGCEARRHRQAGEASASRRVRRQVLSRRCSLDVAIACLWS